MSVILVGIIIFIVGLIGINISNNRISKNETITANEVSEEDLILIKKEISRLDEISRTDYYKNKGE
jgi:hypothetical protein